MIGTILTAIVYVAIIIIAGAIAVGAVIEAINRTKEYIKENK